MSGFIGFLIIAGLAAIYITFLVKQDKRKKAAAGENKAAEAKKKSSNTIAIGLIIGIIVFLVSFVAVAAVREAGRTEQQDTQPTVQDLQNSLDAVRAE